MASTVAPPVFTDTVDQTFFIEALGGDRSPISYLDRFPDTVYTKAIDSVLVTFMYALLGPVGVGLLRKELLEARLEFEEAGLSGADLDFLYTHPFAFARLADETYTVDGAAQLLNAQDRAAILAQDAAFRSRATGFLKAVRAGGTLKGLTLAAQSGLNRPTEIIENYRFLYDQFCDQPLGLPYLGATTNTNEIIVLPRSDTPSSSKQALTIGGEPTSGWFTLTLPLGPNYKQMQVGVTHSSNIVTVPDSSQCPAGVYLSIISPSHVHAQVGSVLSPTSVSLVYPKSAGPTGSNIGTPGQPFNMALATNTYTGYVGNAQTTPLAYNASYTDIQSSLWALPLIGNQDLAVSGGPLPDQPVVIRFTNNLADRDIPALQVNVAPDNIVGIGGPSAIPPLVSQMTQTTNNPLPIFGNVTTDRVGISADDQTMSISPANEHAMELALDQLRPVTSHVTTQRARATTRRLNVNTMLASGAQTEVLRYVIGRRSVAWPAIDGFHWIEGGIEHEAPRPVGDNQHHYQCFHNVISSRAYTEAALMDASYEVNLATINDLYYNTKHGTFSAAQIALFPFLDNYQDPNVRFSPSDALAVAPNPLIITDTVNGVGVVNNEYPADYIGLPGVDQLPTSPAFWSSIERTSGSDFLEIDLGSPQAVNYLYFEATNKPYSIFASYDIYDQSPARRFTSVNLDHANLAPSITSLNYDALATNAWTTVEMHFNNSLNRMIYTRFIRIEFARNLSGTPFIAPTGIPLPYSIEVRNLRVGRNLALPTASQATGLATNV